MTEQEYKQKMPELFNNTPQNLSAVVLIDGKKENICLLNGNSLTISELIISLMEDKKQIRDLVLSYFTTEQINQN